MNEKKYENMREILTQYTIESVNCVLNDELVRKQGANFLWKTTNNAFNPIVWIWTSLPSFTSKKETIKGKQ